MSAKPRKTVSPSGRKAGTEDTAPQIGGTLPASFSIRLPIDIEVLEIVGTASPQSAVKPEHLELIVDLDEPLKRAFYEIECQRGNWGVRELKRQKSLLGRTTTRGAA